MPATPQTGKVLKLFKSLFGAFRTRRAVFAAILIITAIALATICWRVAVRSRLELERERARFLHADLIPTEIKKLSPVDTRQVRIIQSSRTVRAVAKFDSTYFVATDGGLVKLGTNGDVLKRYNVLDGLPESDLVSLAAFHSQLYIGTRSRGLVRFDGQNFESIVWTDRVAQAVTALAEDKGRLLIGTMAGGLLEFDGRDFREIKPPNALNRLKGVNTISTDETGLFVGTFDDGLWIQRAGRWSHFSTADGLLSNRVVGVVVARSGVYVATDFGVGFADRSSLYSEHSGSNAVFKTVAVIPTLSAAARTESGILFSKENGEILSLKDGGDVSRTQAVSAITWKRPEGLRAARLTTVENEIWLLSSEGIRRARVTSTDGADSNVVLGEPLRQFGNFDDPKSLTANIVSALYLDERHQLWVGSFRNGIDVFAANGRLQAHLESEAVREVNSITGEGADNTIVAATSDGATRFDPGLRIVDQESQASGLSSNAVMQFANFTVGAEGETKPTQHLLAFATSRGLSFGEPRRLRTLTTLQGLPSNSLYSLLMVGSRLYVGTLGGLARIEDGRVTQVYTSANSGLTNNWITSLCAVDSRVFAGTYGGGIFELNASDQLVHLPETGQSTVNPNAMWTDGKELFAGTLDGALKLNLKSQKWLRFRSELPAPAVLSVTGDGDHIYFGTSSGIAEIDRAYEPAE